jgi:hypothetical protein
MFFLNGSVAGEILGRLKNARRPSRGRTERRNHMRKGLWALRTLLLGAVVALWLVPISAWGQTTGTGVFAQLSPGQQKIAQALFEAQTKSTAPNAPTPLTLDQIAAKKQGHEGWGEVFKAMKTQGLLTQKNLGQVVSSFERRHPEAAKLEKAERPEKPGKLERVERMEKPERPERTGR